MGFITGGASANGLLVARALGQKGMTVVFADVESDTPEAVRNDLISQGIQDRTEVLDVCDAGVLNCDQN